MKTGKGPTPECNPIVTPTVVKEVVMTTRPSFTFRLQVPAFAFAMLCALAMIATQPAQAQTFSVIHYFSGESDGEHPIAGVTVAGAGKLVGTTSGGRGSVFKLTQN